MYLLSHSTRVARRWFGESHRRRADPEVPPNSNGHGGRPRYP
jgi:hypothetical protein